jgi:hypothetical protein
MKINVVTCKSFFRYKGEYVITVIVIAEFDRIILLLWAYSISELFRKLKFFLFLIKILYTIHVLQILRIKVKYYVFGS